MSSPLLRKPAVVVVTPPWAKDEPPTPDLSYSRHADNLSCDRRSTDNASFNTDSVPTSHWWTFNRTRVRDPRVVGSSQPAASGSRSMSWFTSPTILRDAAAFARKEKQMVDGNNSPVSRAVTDAHESGPFILGPRHDRSRENLHDLREYESNRNQDIERSSGRVEKKRFRNFILVNTYVPLLFRFLNITSTSAALGIATHIRQIESQSRALGVIGSSPMVVIIFAPLTLIHVLAAIYLEYFGRPVGLWRTSAKLAHTLSETLFICAWSAALSLCFDNFFTSLIPCAPSSSISWYSQLPRPQLAPSSFERSTGHQICDDQVALTCLVAFGLLTYCINLIISLFRIFEKVKLVKSHLDSGS